MPLRAIFCAALFVVLWSFSSAVYAQDAGDYPTANTAAGIVMEGKLDLVMAQTDGPAGSYTLALAGSPSLCGVGSAKTAHLDGNAQNARAVASIALAAMLTGRDVRITSTHIPSDATPTQADSCRISQIQLLPAAADAKGSQK